MKDPDGYLARMAAPLRDKVRIVQWFPDNPTGILDVGSADGVVTCEIANMYPEASVLGIELREDFCQRARDRGHAVPNVSFRRGYLGEHIGVEKYDVVTFISVMHEIYSFGGGFAGAARALAGATEVLKPGGRVIIRDMIIYDYAHHTSSPVLAKRIWDNPRAHQKLQVEEFSNRYGSIWNLANLNHYLLKYPYVQNWDSEIEENYVALTWEWYVKAFEVFGLKIIHRESYLLPYLRGLWQTDFNLDDDDLIPFLSTGIIVGELA